MDSGYMDEAWVIARVEAAGFKLAGKSDVNNNPKDNPEIAVAHDTNALLDRLNILLFGGRMTSSLRTIVKGHLDTLPMRTGTGNENTDRYNRVKDAFILLTDSHEFNVAR